jgi:hypothetical protein
MWGSLVEKFDAVLNFCVRLGVLIACLRGAQAAGYAYMLDSTDLHVKK